jgi:hypothetical protein
MQMSTFIQEHSSLIDKAAFDNDQRRAFHALKICRTAGAKGILYSCGKCSTMKFIHHSCGHRFCPNCQNHRTTEWLFRQKQKLLPCDYFMLTFTLPKEFRHIPRHRLKDFYQAFFECTSTAIKELCQTRLKGDCGMLGVLHTNGRTLQKHPHIHYVIPGIFIDKKQSHVKRLSGKYFLPHLALMERFRGKFLERLKELGISFPNYLYGRKWNVNCDNKGNGHGVLEYLSRYLVKGVVSQNSLVENENDITLKYRNSNSGSMEQIKFSKEEFIQRLGHHVLPKGLRSVRHYGFLAPAAKKMLQRVQLLLKAKLPNEDLPPAPKVKCPHCKDMMKPLFFKVSESYFEEKYRNLQRNKSPP